MLVGFFATNETVYKESEAELVCLMLLDWCGFKTKIINTVGANFMKVEE